MKRRRFSLKTCLSTIDGGRKELTLPKKQMVFSQGDPADSVLYVQKGKVKLSVVAKRGKEATIGVLNEGDFFGEGCLTGQPLRMCSATAMTDCTVMRIGKKSMMEVIHSETCVLRYVRRIFADGTFATKRIWLISFSILGKKTGSHSSAAGSLRQGREARSCDSQDQSGESGRDGGHNS